MGSEADVLLNSPQSNQAKDILNGANTLMVGVWCGIMWRRESNVVGHDSRKKLKNDLVRPKTFTYDLKIYKSKLGRWSWTRQLHLETASTGKKPSSV